MTHTIRISPDVASHIMKYAHAYERTFKLRCTYAHALRLAVAHVWRKRGRRPTWVAAAKHELSQIGTI